MITANDEGRNVLALTIENVEPYLREREWIIGNVRVDVLSGGVSNLVFRITHDGGRFVLKQSCPQLRVADPWFSDLNRVFREQAVMDLLEPLFPADTIPRVLHRDPDNFAFAMSHAPDPAIAWRTTLLAGEADPVRAEQAGSILSRIHSIVSASLLAFDDRTVFHQLRTEPFYERICERVPDVASHVGPLIERCHKAKVGLCHGDFSPKNLLAHPSGFTLVDHETACLGDPAFDIGFFVSHLLLKVIHFSPNDSAFQELVPAFRRGYDRELPEGWAGHLGACMLARIEGTSPVPYLRDETKRERARRWGRHILIDQPEYEELGNSSFVL